MRGKDAGQVQQSARWCCHRDPTERADVPSVELSNAVDAHTLSVFRAPPHDRDVDIAARIWTQRQHRRRRVVAEDRALAAGQDCRKLPGQWRQNRVADEINASVKAMQPSVGDTVGDRAAAQPGLAQLGACHDPVLRSGNLSDGPIAASMQNLTCAASRTARGEIRTTLVHNLAAAASTRARGRLCITPMGHGRRLRGPLVERTRYA
jgi:hypothetical protein